MKRALGILFGLVAVYVVAVTVGSYSCTGSAVERAESRIASAFDAEVEVGGAELGLWRGSLVLEDVRIVRVGSGQLSLSIPRIELDFQGGGLAIFGADLDRARVSGAEMKVSAAGAAEAVRGKYEPLELDEILIEDSKLIATASALLPSLGRLELTIDRARAEGVSMASALDWLRGLEELDAELRAPGDIRVAVAFRDNALWVKASILGSDEVRVPFAIPTELDGFELALLKNIAIAAARETAKHLAVDAAKDQFWKLLSDDP